jgi:hypothetical protein
LGAWSGCLKQEGRNEVAEFFVYTCRQCHGAYAGAIEITERLPALGDRAGLCGVCLEHLVGWHPIEEEVESREDNSGTAPNA